MNTTLDNVINNSVKLKHQNGFLTFEEPNAEARLRKLKLRLTSFLRKEGGSVKNAIVVKGDLDSSPYGKFSYYLSDNCEHINKRCDYIIFHFKDNEVRIILCELKSSAISLDEDARCHAQFDISMEFAKYLLGISDKYRALTNPDEGDFPIAFYKVVFLPVPNVASTAALGVAPKINIKKNRDGIHVVSVNSCPATGCGELLWHQLMQSIS
ncbi:hypothetical protein ACPV5J_21250 [Vibrio rotiferianus]|uniref:hypothetical protein n=1 Tax=Vibrio rotiferianus TaxID=190895 RepID=UPI00406A8671